MSEREVYAKFRVSVDNGFRNEFSYVDYRRWGVVEVWAAGRIKGEPPRRVDRDQRIEVWFNWEIVGAYVSYREAKNKIDALLEESPVDLRDLVHYLEIEP